MTIRILLFFFLVLAPVPAGAQGGADAGAMQAERILTLLRTHRADSIVACLGDDVRAQLGAGQIEEGWSQVEGMLGQYDSHTAWTHDRAEGYDVYSSTVTFGQGQQLTVRIALDAGLKVAGLRMMPVMPEYDNEPLPDGVVETEDTVRTSEGVRLPCTITLTGLSERPTMVVMVHGSGPLDRDETVMGNKTFRDLARQLAERGINSLRYDKRTFVYRDPVSTMDDEVVLDALAALRLAGEYSGGRVVLLGHSLGAMMAPAIAKRAEPGLCGVVMMAAPARNLEQVVAEQVAYLSADGTATEEERQQAMAQMRQQAPHYFEPQHQVETALSLQLPMLLLQGERDYQVTMADYRLWRQALSEKPDVLMHSYAGLNHLFLYGDGPSTPQEYLTKGTIPAQVADDIAAFVLGLP